MDEYADYPDETPTPERSWAIEDECGHFGHIYHGDDHPNASDGQGGRCYCGTKRYPTGGPPPRSVEDGA